MFCPGVGGHQNSDTEQKRCVLHSFGSPVRVKAPEGYPDLAVNVRNTVNLQQFVQCVFNVFSIQIQNIDQGSNPNSELERKSVRVATLIDLIRLLRLG